MVQVDWIYCNTLNGAVIQQGSEQNGVQIYFEPPFVLGESPGVRDLPRSAPDLEAIATIAADEPNNILTPRGGQLDLAPSQVSFDFLGSRIEAAQTAIQELIKACAEGNQPHAVLGEFARQYRDALIRLQPSNPGILWYIKAQQIEAYRANYGHASQMDPAEHPPLDPGMSTIIDSVVLASGILARRFPEM